MVYGPGNQRIKTTLSDSTGVIKTKYFSLNYEKEIVGTTTRHLNYIYSPYGLVAVIIKQDNADTLYYTETDHLGSIIALVNTDGTNAERYSYDSWGRRRNPDDWSYESIPEHRLTDKGFTGHEHLDEFDLINMNSRLYDIILTLLSALIFVVGICIGTTFSTYLTSRFYNNNSDIDINNI